MSGAARRSVTIPEAMRVALDAHRQGEFDKAETIYRQVIGAVPNHAQAAGLLGLVLVQTERPAEAEPLVRKALSQAPLDPVHHNTLGSLLRGTQRLEEAIAAYREAVRLAPNLGEAHVSLGLALREAGQLEEARAVLHQGLALAPESALAHLHMGLTLRDAGDMRAALASVERACELAPQLVDAQVNRAALLGELLRHEEALAAAQAAFAIAPADPAVLVNLGSALAASGDYLEAIQRFRAALVHDPLDARMVTDIAGCLYGLGRTREAAETFRRAVLLDPSSTDSHSLMLFAQNYYEEDAAALLAAHRGFATSLGEYATLPPAAVDATPGRRLRVGYVSPDFRQHSVAFFFAPLLAHRDRDRFESVCFQVHPASDGVTARLRTLADEWIEAAHLDPDALAQRIRDARIDLLVDLAGHTAGGRLPAFARRPAPVQLTYLGYPTTTGLDAMDFRITDTQVDPVGEPLASTEQPLRLNTSYFCFEPGAAPDVAPLPALRAGHLTFGSFNNLAKLSDATVALWAAVLRRLPDARLLLKTRGLGAPATQAEVRSRFAALGIDPGRVDCVPWIATQTDHRSAYAAVDIGLDTYPYNGATTTCEALWMGVPVVSRFGTTHASRMGRSILAACALGELAASSDDAFVAAAAALAADVPALAHLRTRLRAQVAASSLCDAPAFVARFERALEQAWDARAALR